MNTTTISTTQGAQARSKALRLTCAGTGVTACASGSSALTVINVAGCHTRRNSISANIDTSAAPMAVNQGPCRFEISSCAPAKLTAATSTAGHTSSVRRQPQ